MKLFIYLYICEVIRSCLFICLFVKGSDNVCLFVYLFICKVIRSLDPSSPSSFSKELHTGKKRRYQSKSSARNILFTMAQKARTTFSLIDEKNKDFYQITTGNYIKNSILNLFLICKEIA